ncbi:PAS domain S-box protein [filamentous cyanobacterium LEGE 07170]|nr:PAS domain S-box protein [filamentous cyanobacterium LEGE 07170]
MVPDGLDGWPDNQMDNLDEQLFSGSAELCREGFPDLHMPKVAQSMRCCLHTFFDRALDAMLLANAQGRCVRANAAATKLFALAHERLVGRAIAELIQPSDDPSWPSQGATCVVRPDGSVREIHYSAIANALPGLQLLTLQDVTEQRQRERALAQTMQATEQQAAQRIAELNAEIHALQASNQQLQASQRKYQAIFERLPIGMAITDADGHFIEINPASTTILGSADISHHQCIFDVSSQAAGDWDSRPMPAEASPIVEALREQRVIQGWEQRISHPDGAMRWLSVSVAPLPLEAQGVAIAYLDITAQKQAELDSQERAQREHAFSTVVQAIHSSLEVDTLLARSLSAISAYLDADASILQYAQSETCWRHLRCYRRNTRCFEPCGMTVPDMGTAFAEQLKQLHIVQTTVTANTDDPILQALAPQESGAWLLVPIAVDGAVWGSLNLGKAHRSWVPDEIALAKRMANQLAIALHQANLYQQLRLTSERDALVVHQIIGEGVWDWNLVTDLGTASDRHWDILGYGDRCSSHTTVQAEIARIHPDDHDRVYTACCRHLETGERYDVEFRMRHRDGHYIWIRERGQAIWDEQGNPVRMVGIVEDVSDRKHTETALRQSEAKTRAILSAIPDLLIRIGADGRYRELVTDSMHLDLFFNGCDPVGRTVAEFLPTSIAERQNDYIQSALRTGELQVYEHQLSTADGWSYEEIRILKSGDDEVLFMVRDISDRKRLEQDLQDSYDQLASILDSSFACIAKFRLFKDASCIYDYVSPKSTAIYGYSPEELMRNPDLWRLHIVPDDVARVVQPTIQAVFDGQTRGDLEYRFHHRNGSIRWVRENITARRDEAQDCWIITTVAIDVSQRKYTEIALQESEAFRRKITELAPIAIFIYDFNLGTLVFCNPAYESILGYTLQEIQAMGADFLPTIFHPDDRANLEAHVRTLRDDRDGRVYEVEYAYRRKDGSTMFGYSREMVLTRNPDGTAAQTLGFGLDITVRKTMELALRQREYEFRALAENAPDCIVRCDRHYRFLYVNPMVARTMGIDSAQFLGRTSEELGWPRDLVQLLHQSMEQAFVTGQEQVLEYKFPQEMGYSVYSSQIVPERDTEGEIISVLMIARDITALMQAQDALIHQADRERTLRLITQHMRETLDLKTILSAAVTEVQRVLNADRTLIFRLNSDRSGIVIQEAVRPEFPSVLNICWKDECFAAECYDFYCQGEGRIVSDLSLNEWGDCLVGFMRVTQVKSKIVAPITQRHTDGSIHLWGLLIAHACAEPRQWQADELELLQQVADQLAIATQQSELYQQVQQWAETLEEQVQERTATLQQALDFEALLKRITDRVRDSLDEDQILETAVRELGLKLRLECCDTGIYNADRTISTITHEFTRTLTPAKGKTCEIAKAAHGDIYSAVFAGITSQFCDRVSSTLRPDRMRLTILVCPIRDDQATLGDIWLMRTSDHYFSDLEIRLVKQVATQCAIALRQARLFKATQMQVAELKRLHQLKDDFLSTVSHELRTPMASIKMATELLEVQLKEQSVLPLEFPDGEEDGAIARYFNILKAEGIREITLIDDLLDLTRLDAKTEPLHLAAVQLQDWLPYLLETFLARAQQHHQQLTMAIAPDLPCVTTDLSYLQRIINELLNNACKYTPPGESIALDAVMEDGRLLLTIANSGIEIPLAERDRIFERFYRIPNGDPWKHGGTGLGLALVKAMVEYLQGKIWVEADSGQTRFLIQLPIQLQGKAVADPQTSRS